MSNSEFLKHLITEDLYIITENRASTVSEAKNAEPKTSTDPENSIVQNNEVQVTRVPLLVRAQVSNDLEKELLSKVLAAVGFQINQVTVVTSDEQHTYASSKVLAFSDVASKYYVVEEEKGVETLNSRSLSTLSTSIEDKKALWSALKNWFEV